MKTAATYSEFDAEKDYSDMVSAWQQYTGWTPPPVEVLPARGYVARDDDGEFLAYAGLYLDHGGTVALIDWGLVNPDVPVPVARQALGELVRRCEGAAKSYGAAYMISFTAERGWGQMLTRNGMTPDSGGVTTYIKALKPDFDTEFMTGEGD